MNLIQQNQTAQPLIFMMVDDTDHLTGKTGLTPTVTISKNGGSFASPAGAVTEVGSGWYKIAGNATDADTLGKLVIHAAATGADDSDTVYQVVAFDPATAYAVPGDEMDLVDAPNATAVTAIQSGLATSSEVSGVPAAVWTETTRELTAIDATIISGNISGTVGGIDSVTFPVNFDLLAIDANGVVDATLGSTEHDDIAAALLDLTDGVESGVTVRQSLRLSNSAGGGKLSGAATSSIVIRDVNDTKDRVTATVDADGNRSAVTLDLD